MRFQHYFLVFFIFAMSLLFITEQKPGRSLKQLAWGACLPVWISGSLSLLFIMRMIWVHWQLKVLREITKNF